MKGKRAARLNEQLRRELSELIRTEVRDPRVGLVTITGVDVAADLGSARVFVRANEEELASSLEGLAAAAPFLRSALGKALYIRKVPELRFQQDRSLEHAWRIERILSVVIVPEPPAEEAAGDGEPPREDAAEDAAEDE
jgi:ribosome-binding factor A